MAVTVVPKYRLFPSMRLFICLLCFVGIAINFSLFCTIHFAWVCMVNESFPITENNSVDTHPGTKGNLNWDKQVQQHIFAGYHLGGAFSLIFSGTLVNMFGAKLVFAGGLAIEMLSTALIPIAAHWHYLLVAVLRVCTGLGSSVLFPVAYDACAHWAPISELGIMLALITGGLQFGGMVSLTMDGLECHYLSWPYIFYLASMAALIFLILWMAMFKNDPAKSPWISENEKLYIIANRNRTEKKKVPIPYKSVFSSMAVWSIAISSMSAGVIGFLASFMPSYFKEVLHLDVATNGFFSALPYLAMFLGRMVSGPLSDKITCFKSPEPVLKIFNCIGLGGASLGLLCMTIVTHDTPQPLILFILFTLYFTFAFVTGGFLKSPLYIAPQYSGFIGSMQMLPNYVCSVGLPYLVSALTPNGTAAEWYHVFYTLIASACGGTVVFCIFGKGKIQKWANDSKNIRSKDSTVSMITLSNDSEF